jgi:hypothetical protein
LEIVLREVSPTSSPGRRLWRANAFRTKDGQPILPNPDDLEAWLAFKVVEAVLVALEIVTA